MTLPAAKSATNVLLKGAFKGMYYLLYLIYRQSFHSLYVYVHKKGGRGGGGGGEEDREYEDGQQYEPFKCVAGSLKSDHIPKNIL